MNEGIIQKAFNQFRANRLGNLGNYIIHEETLHLEREIVEKIKAIRKDKFANLSNGQIKVLNFYEEQLIGDYQK